MLDIPTLVNAMSTPFVETDFPDLGEKSTGKVRDIYKRGQERYLIATDRFSAFDRVLGAIPFRGQILSQLSAFWFHRLQDIVPNHFIDMYDPNVMKCREADALPVEVIVRGYITGVTPTSLWTLYDNGVEKPYGLTLPEGLQKNQKLSQPVITPTTKGGPGERDERLSEEEIIERGIVAPDLWQQVREVSLALFARGEKIAEEGGLILVDTKYEFGLVDGQLTLIDEVHTPDSSRYWKVEGYEEAFAAGREPEGFSKEFLRLWLKKQGFDGEGTAPQIPSELLAEAAQRYIAVFEALSGVDFYPAEQPAQHRIRHNLFR